MRPAARVTTAVLGIAAAASIATADSNIAPSQKFSWGENIGFMNWRDANSTTDGVRIFGSHLRGYIWSENCGWINVGNGPASGTSYANLDGSDFGVNILPGGDLEGFAWAENLGWINFDTGVVAPDQARYDAAAGRFRGFAWSENAGWINLDDNVVFVCGLIADLNGDGSVGPSDLSILLSTFNLSDGDSGYNGAADLNGDDSVGPSDLSILLTQFNTSC